MEVMKTKTTRKAGRSTATGRVVRHRVGPSKAEKARKFVLYFICDNGHGPTYTEIQRATSVGDTTALYRGLVEAGLITFKAGDYRTARLTPEGVRHVEETLGHTRADKPRASGPGIARTTPDADKIVSLNIALPMGMLEELAAVVEEKRKIAGDREKVFDATRRAIAAAIATG
jgi:hypothetical protein